MPSDRADAHGAQVAAASGVPQRVVDRGGDAGGGGAVGTGTLVVTVAGRGPRRGLQATDDGRRGVCVLAVLLLPEVHTRLRQTALRVEEPKEEVGGPPGRRPEVGVQVTVPELLPRRLGGEEDHACLVELMETPRWRELPRRPVTMEPQALRRLDPNEPAQRRRRLLAATGGEQAEDDVREVARPHEAVAAGLDESLVHLRRGHDPARLAVGQLVEDEHGPPCESRQLRVGVDGRRNVREDRRVGRTATRDDAPWRRRVSARSCERLERRGSEGEDDVDDVLPGLEQPLQRAEVRNGVGYVVVRPDGRRCGRRVGRDGERHGAAVEDHGTSVRVDVTTRLEVAAREARRAEDNDVAGWSRDLANEHRLERIDGVDDLYRAGCRVHGGAEHGDVVRHPRLTPRTRVLVEPGDRVPGPESETQLGYVTPPVHVRPEQALHLAARRQRDQQRAVAQHSGREVLRSPPCRVRP